MCFDRDPSYLEECIPKSLSDSVVFHDGSQDVLGWNGTSPLNIDTDLAQYLNNRPGNHGNLSVAVVIDSLSPLLLHRPATYTCQVINKLLTSKVHTADVEQVVTLVHGDLHDNHSLTLVCYLATSIIKVQQSRVQQFCMSASILHKKISGKVVKLTEHFNFDINYTVKDVTEIKAVDTSKVAMETNQVDPAANLTFNLTLTDKEKEARSQVKLPYTHDVSRQDETLSKSVGEGKIFYQPDEADDFDEEDPDDDLDI